MNAFISKLRLCLARVNELQTTFNKTVSFDYDPWDAHVNYSKLIVEHKWRNAP